MNVEAVTLDQQRWKAFNSRARRRLTDRDLDWLVEGAGLFTQKRRIDQAICTTFDNPEWWPAWRDWRNECRDHWSNHASGREGSLDQPVALTYPPDEPVGLWERAEQLLARGSYLESVSAALIRLLLAQGRVARELLA